jgi:hypothetical protein
VLVLDLLGRGVVLLLALLGCRRRLRQVRLAIEPTTCYPSLIRRSLFSG